MKIVLLAFALLLITGVVCAQEDAPSNGRRNKIAGAVLIGLGSAIQVAGMALALKAISNQPPLLTLCPAWASCPEERPVSVSIAGGSVMAIAGALLTLIGIPVFAVGGAEKRKALRLTASGMRLEF